MNNKIMLNTGALMPLVGFGTWNISGRICENCVIDAIETGYRLIDTAKMYGNEKNVGNAIKNSGIKREDIFLVTKLNQSCNGYNLAKTGIEQSLNDLKTEYIDLLLIHEPYSNSFEIYEAMKEELKNGKLKAIGISNFNERLYKEFVSKCGILPAVNQVETHIFCQKQNLQDIMKKDNVQMMAWSPFACGLNNIFENPVLKGIARKYNKTSAQTALRFLVQRGICVIPKTTHKERMKENLNIFDFELTSEDMENIKSLDTCKTSFSWTTYCENAKLN